MLILLTMAEFLMDILSLEKFFTLKTMQMVARSFLVLLEMKSISNLTSDSTL